jgi:hypothetical protein
MYSVEGLDDGALFTAGTSICSRLSLPVPTFAGLSLMESAAAAICGDT